MNPTNTNTNNQNLPSRLRESSFRRYEPYIKSAVATFPELLIIDQTQFNGSLATFASRLRDAMASLAVYHWTSELVNMDKFDEIYPMIKVSHVMPDRVLIGSNENIKEYYKQQNLPPSQFECLTAIKSVETTPLTSTNASVVSASNATAVQVSLSQDTHDKGVELKLLAGLAALRLLANVVQIEIDSEQAQWLEENFDVVVTKVTDTDTKYNLQ